MATATFTMDRRTQFPYRRLVIRTPAGGADVYNINRHGLVQPNEDRSARINDITSDEVISIETDPWDNEPCPVCTPGLNGNRISPEDSPLDTDSNEGYRMRYSDLCDSDSCSACSTDLDGNEMPPVDTPLDHDLMESP